MSTINQDNQLSLTLFGKTRRAVLALLFSHADESFYLRQIEKLTGVAAGPLQRELKQLTGASIVTRSESGRQVYYQANRQNAVFAELRGLVIKTTGVADILLKALSPFSHQIECAFIYGSFAAGKENARSDLDLMVIGSVSLEQLIKTLKEPEDILGREISPSLYEPREITRRLRVKEPFIIKVLREPKIMLLGAIPGVLQENGRTIKIS
jgi:predicted nucleotidyltransferase